MTKILILIASLLEAIIAPKAGRFIREGDSVTWFPIITISESGSCMGISSIGEWVVEVSEGIHHLDKPQLYVYVMALLERPYEDVYEEISSMLIKISVTEEPSCVFPFVNIVIAGFEQGSDYWATLAFDWFDLFSREHKLHLLDALSNVVNAKWASQKNRQKAKRELKRLSA